MIAYMCKYYNIIYKKTNSKESFKSIMVMILDINAVWNMKFQIDALRKDKEILIKENILLKEQLHNFVFTKTLTNGEKIQIDNDNNITKTLTNGEKIEIDNNNNITKDLTNGGEININNNNNIVIWGYLNGDKIEIDDDNNITKTLINGEKIKINDDDDISKILTNDDIIKIFNDNLILKYLANNDRMTIDNDNVIMKRMMNEEIIQIINDKTINNFSFIDLSTLNNINSLIEIERLEKELESIRYNLESDSLFNLTIIKLNDFTHHFVWTQHHIILDGWSNSILKKDSDSTPI